MESGIRLSRRLGLSLEVSLILVVFLVSNVTESYFLSRTRTPVILTKSGPIEGTVETSRGGRSFYAFRGIPYASPPVGELRFKDPRPVKAWTDTLNATKYGSLCIQVDIFTRSVLGTEDCLFLNIFTPKLDLNRGKNYNVLVFIHGGVFMSGNSNMYGSEYFMDEDVVLVTINYRLGSFGFLNTGDEVVRGNAGLKDQVKALKWIQRNIEQFGGNPNSVTLIGESAGASSVHMHMISDMSKGLFHKAISQSGTAINAWAFFDEPAAQAKRFARKVNCPTNSSLEMVSCLREIDAQKLVDHHKEILYTPRSAISIFGPTAETIDDENTFLSDSPLKLVQRGHFRPIPWLTGVLADEGLIFSAELVRNETALRLANEHWNELAPMLLYYEKKPYREISERIRNFYFDPKSPSNSVGVFNNYTKMFSDRAFFHPVHQAAKYHAPVAPTYLYFYTYKQDFNLGGYLLAIQGKRPFVMEVFMAGVETLWKKYVLGEEIPRYGICHGEELTMHYRVRLISDIPPGTRDYPMSKSMVKAWVGFAENHKNLTFNNVKWTQVNPKEPKLQYMKLDSRGARMIPEPFTKQLELWDSLKLES